MTEDTHSMGGSSTTTPELPTGIAGGAVASSFALGAFITAVAAGLSAGAEPISVLWRAIVSMIVCYLLGLALGAVGVSAVREHIEQHIDGNPIPDVPPMPPDAPGKPEATGPS